MLTSIGWSKDPGPSVSREVPCYFYLYHFNFCTKYYLFLILRAIIKKQNPCTCIRKHMGLIHFIFRHSMSPSQFHIRSTTPFLPKTTPFPDKIRYLCIFTQSPQALESTDVSGIFRSLKKKQA